MNSKNEIKWNWGMGIAVVYIVFVVGMLSMVFLSKNQKIDLVTENYYQQELEFQEEIDAKQRAENQGCIPILTRNRGGFQVDIPNSKGMNIEGQLWAYCPSNKVGDHVIVLPKTTSGGWFLNLSGLYSSSYILKFHWTRDGERYSASLPFTK
jgi:hypothetical protein